MCSDVRIGGKAGSNFNPYVKSGKPSHRTASSSYDSNLNDEEGDSNLVMLPTPPQVSSDLANSQNLNRNQTSFKNEECTLDKNLLDYLDNYSTDVLQKTALVLLEKSLTRARSFELPASFAQPIMQPRSTTLSEKESSKNETMSEESLDFKPCNCRKSKCLKLYCECFSNGRKCTSKCDCFSCCNTVAHEDLISKAKEQIITRNPDAFKPKFSEEEETKKNKSVKHQRG